MGSCFSSSSSFSSSSEASYYSGTSSTAKVISTKGDLHEYSIPVRASQVLESETDSPASFFVCNSDRLYYDDYIPALDSTDLLQPDQIYFVLPVARLQYPLTTSDMAGLAVKASAALLECSKEKKKKTTTMMKGLVRRKKKIRVSPALDLKYPSGKFLDGEFGFVDEFYITDKRFKKGVVVGGGGGGGSSIGLARSESVRKLQRSASRRAKIVYKSFKMRLSTIYENDQGSIAAAAH